MRITESKIKHLPKTVCAFCWLEKITLNWPNRMGAFSHALREEQVKLKLKHVPMSWEFYGLYCTCVCVSVCLVAVRHEQHNKLPPPCAISAWFQFINSLSPQLAARGRAYICLICAILIIHIVKFISCLIAHKLQAPRAN